MQIDGGRGAWSLRILTGLGLAACLALAWGCDPAQQQAAQRSEQEVRDRKAARPGAKTASGKRAPAVLPVPRASRDYQNVHANVNQAWFLVETSYFVVGDKLASANTLMASADPAERERGIALKQQNSSKIQEELFAPNPSVSKLFEDAIAAEPKNPLNLVAYAFYLKPRRDPATYKESLPKALELMDEAIALWPDESSFYFLKAQMLVSGNAVYQFSRTTLAEESAIAGVWQEVRDLLSKAEQYDPQNAQINYYRAHLAARFAPMEGSEDSTREMLREIKAGNNKDRGRFVFPPPLEPYPDNASMPRITVGMTGATHYDHWMQNGGQEKFGLDKCLHLLAHELDWKKDKEDIAAVMYMLYNLGRTQPTERTYFASQQKFLEKLRDQQAEQQSKTEISLLLFSLGEYYSECCSKLSAERMAVDAREYNVVGIEKAEMGTLRSQRLRELIQPYHAAFLRASEKTLGVKFPLDKDSANWGR